MSKENSVDAMSTDNSDSVTSSEQEVRKSCTSTNKQRNTSMASSKRYWHHLSSQLCVKGTHKRDIA